MGRLKAWIMEQEAQGFDSKPTFVCSNCIDDDALIKYIKKNGSTENVCSYCIKKAKLTLPFNTFIRYFLEGLESEWGDPNDEGVAWEHGWVGEVFDTWDILDSEIDVSFSTDRLSADIADSLSDHQWCQKNFYELKPHQALSSGWTEFTRMVKHQARYVFLRMEESENSWRGHEEIPPSYFLDALGSVIADCGLYSQLGQGTEILRVRLHECDEEYTKAVELGAPPSNAAIYSNRMSAAGISAFYGAFDQDTALMETINPNQKKPRASVGYFQIHRELLVVDLTKLPTIPSIFEPRTRNVRQGLVFLRNFMRDFTAPIDKDGREHIDYVPTQIVAEYLRFVHQLKGRKIDGVLYPSSRKPGSAACVLFIDSEQSVDLGNETDSTALVLVKTETLSLK